METSAYILFPENEDQIYSIIESQDVFDSFVKESVWLLKSINQKGIKLYYDSENIGCYFDVCATWRGVKNIEKGRDITRRFLSKKSTDVNTRSLKDNACKYILWNFDNSPTVEDNPPKTIVEITERKYKYEEDKCLLIDIHHSIKSCRNVLITFKDAKHISNSPAPFIRIPHILNNGELELWLKTSHITEFALFDKSRFRRTGRTYQGKPIFQEIETENYWYLDNFHKNEYEVFNSNCHHLGTATLQGEMNLNSQVYGRTITL